MRGIRVSEDFVPVSEFKAQAADWLRKLGETGSPMVITLNGRPAAVLLSPQAFDELTEKVRSLEAVEEGLADAKSGRVVTHQEALRRMKSRYPTRAK